MIQEPKTPVKSPVRSGEDDKFLDSPSNDNENTFEREKEYQSPIKASNTFLKLALNSEIVESPVKTTKQVSQTNSVAKSQQPTAVQPLLTSGPVVITQIERKETDSPQFGQQLEKIEEPPTPSQVLSELRLQPQKTSDTKTLESLSNVASPKTPVRSAAQTTTETVSAPAEEKKKQKMIITGDDILIEYVQRICLILESLLGVFSAKSVQQVERIDEVLPQQLRYTLEKFCQHKIWSNKLSVAQKQLALVKRLQLRHKEMTDRRTKILTTALKKAKPQINK